MPSICCKSRVYNGRCFGCGRWQRMCSSCGGPFAAKRRHALTCGSGCRKRRSRGATMPPEAPRSARKGPEGDIPTNTPRAITLSFFVGWQDAAVTGVLCAGCRQEMKGLEGPLPIPTYCTRCAVNLLIAVKG